MMESHGSTRRDFLRGRQKTLPAASNRRHAVIGGGCFAHNAITCQSCADACPAAAIGFRPRLGGPALPALNIASCTGCGDCIAACPASAITFAVETDVHV
jgi:formate hydrogenlyase subunit 6/NADH:ubiquinone oxidoreductase subunit I